MGSAAGHKSVRCLTLSRDCREVTSMKAISASVDDAAAPRQPCERSDGAHTGGPGGQMSWAELVARGWRRAAHPWRCSRGAASSRAGGALRIGTGAGSGGGLRASLRCQEPQPSCCLRSIAKRKTALKGQTSTGAQRKRALGAGGWGRCCAGTKLEGEPPTVQRVKAQVLHLPHEEGKAAGSSQAGGDPANNSLGVDLGMRARRGGLHSEVRRGGGEDELLQGEQVQHWDEDLRRGGGRAEGSATQKVRQCQAV